jgi:hypothetical protein
LSSPFPSFELLHPNGNKNAKKRMIRYFILLPFLLPCRRGDNTPPGPKNPY